MSTNEFDYDGDDTEETSPLPSEEWYAAIVNELRDPGIVAYASDDARDSATEESLKEAAIGEAAMLVSMHRRGARINEETAAVMVMPDYTAICFWKNGQRITLRLTVGDLLVVTPETLFSQGPN